jgi:hypothetical protein
MTSTPRTCTNCSKDITSYDEKCSDCGTVIDPPPNVRMAIDVSGNLEMAYRAVAACATSDRLTQLEAHSEASGRVVVNMRFLTIRHLLESTGATYGNFWEDFQTDAISDRVRDNVARRMQVDAALYGHLCKSIRCGLLSFESQGAAFYGPFAATLKGNAVHHRVSLLEANPFNVPLDQVTKLHRAAWDMRSRLVAVRYGPDAIARPGEPIATILSIVGSSRTGQRFVEAHIWGKFGAGAIDSIVAQVPRSGADVRLAADIARIAELSAKKGIAFTQEPDRS